MDKEDGRVVRGIYFKLPIKNDKDKSVFKLQIFHKEKSGWIGSALASKKLAR